MASTTDQRLLLSIHTEVYAGGFRSDIGQMSRHGWKFESFQDSYSMDMVIRGILPEAEIQFTDRHPYHSLHLARDRAGIPRIVLDPRVVMQVKVARLIESNQFDINSFSRNVDIGIMSTDYHDVHVIEPRECEEGTRDLIVMPEDIPELMDKILEAQKPRQRDLIRKDVELEKLEQTARILTFKR